MIILVRSGSYRTSGTYASLVDAMRLCSLLSSWLDVLLRGIIGTCFYERVPQVRRLENVGVRCRLMLGCDETKAVVIKAGIGLLSCTENPEKMYLLHYTSTYVS